jgi:hypothetical protein
MARRGDDALAELLAAEPDVGFVLALADPVEAPAAAPATSRPHAPTLTR